MSNGWYLHWCRDCNWSKKDHSDKDVDRCPDCNSGLVDLLERW